FFQLNNSFSFQCARANCNCGKNIIGGRKLKHKRNITTCICCTIRFYVGCNCILTLGIVRISYFRKESHVGIGYRRSKRVSTAYFCSAISILLTRKTCKNYTAQEKSRNDKGEWFHWFK